jgi:DNA-binding SARP family transcriptional activator/tetratricopeptide (TPR) repeat protein
MGAAQQRAVLAALAVDAGRPVMLQTLVDRVWDEAPPAGSRSALYAHITRIRQALHDGGAGGQRQVGPVRRAGGYVLDVDPDRVDLHRFRDMVAAARDGARSDAERAGLLRAALDLWQGPPLADLSSQWATRMRDSWSQQRLDAVVAWGQAELRLNRPAEVIGPVRDLLADHPLAEPLVAVLLRALASAGRDAEALDHYATARARLVSELGAEPGPELRAIHEAVLRGEFDVPVVATSGGHRPVPAQLPANVRGFSGRDTELRQLDDILTGPPGGHPSTVLISAVSGTAGVGKTALAVHWAHRVADRFPDGQLHVNLRGFDPDGRIMDTAAAVRGFLDSLGVPAEQIPTGFEAQVGLYRSLLAGKRVLVVLDNARDADHVRPLLPGTGTAVAVVTSRNVLIDLVAADGAYPLALDLLTEVESRELLERRLGPRRVASEPDAARWIIEICARLPLALTLVAARAATHPSFSLAAVAAELADAAHRASVSDDRDDVIGRVRAVFSWSYTMLSPAAARLFRLLGLHPGPDATAPAVASLAGLPLPHVWPLLAELGRAGLLGEQVPGRYGCHDLLAAYAAYLTDTQDSEQEREAATVRLLDHYIHTAHAADRHLNPTRDPIQVPLAPPAPGVTPEQLADQQTALQWLDAERSVLLAAQQAAAAAGRDAETWQLPWVLHTLLQRRGRWYEAAGAWQAAMPAARRLPHPAAAYVHRNLGGTLIRLGDDEQAHVHFQHALQLHTEAADSVGQAHTHHALCSLWDRRERSDQALDHAQRALALYQATDHRFGQADALNAVGWCHARLGDHAQALTYCQQALALNQQLGDRYGQANTWDSLGYAHHHLNQHAEAADCYQHALILFRDLGDRYNEATTLTRVGEAHHAAGQPEQARAAWVTALEILTALNHSDADLVRAKLATLD